jgi:predicted O-methyltransferase YrrM
MSLDDDEATQIFSDYVLVAEAIKYAALNPITPDFEFANVFPGEHYRILSGLIDVIKPKILVDIGTYRGSSARIMLDYGHSESKVHTFDLHDYLHFDWTVLKESDFTSNRLVQHLDDLIVPEEFNKHRSLLEQADFIMLDGPKDDHFEKTFLHMLKDVQPSGGPKWLFIDDIRFDNMQDLWRSIKSPKLDLSSFGHFSGSGLVNITAGLVI